MYGVPVMPMSGESCRCRRRGRPSTAWSRSPTAPCPTTAPVDALKTVTVVLLGREDDDRHAARPVLDDWLRVHLGRHHVPMSVVLCIVFAAVLVKVGSMYTPLREGFLPVLVDAVKSTEVDPSPPLAPELPPELDELAPDDPPEPDEVAPLLVPELVPCDPELPLLLGFPELLPSSPELEPPVASVALPLPPSPEVALTGCGCAIPGPAPPGRELRSSSDHAFLRKPPLRWQLAALRARAPSRRRRRRRSSPSASPRVADLWNARHFPLTIDYGVKT